jgi:hypothetical protein
MMRENDFSTFREEPLSLDKIVAVSQGQLSTL